MLSHWKVGWSVTFTSDLLGYQRKQSEHHDLLLTAWALLFLRAPIVTIIFIDSTHLRLWCYLLLWLASPYLLLPMVAIWSSCIVLYVFSIRCCSEWRISGKDWMFTEKWREQRLRLHSSEKVWGINFYNQKNISMNGILKYGMIKKD